MDFLQFGPGSANLLIGDLCPANREIGVPRGGIRRRFQRGRM
jgi:hypothetical protein